jgi:hypothetical protein
MFAVKVASATVLTPALTSTSMTWLDAVSASQNRSV